MGKQRTFSTLRKRAFCYLPGVVVILLGLAYVGAHRYSVWCMEEAAREVQSVSAAAVLNESTDVAAAYESVGRWVRRAAAVNTGAGMLIVGLLGWVGFRATRDLAAPLAATSRAAERLALGELEVQFREGGPQELQSIEDALKHMISEVKYHRHTLSGMVAARTQSLETARNALAKNASQLRASYDSAQEAILIVEAGSGRILQANRRFHALFGFDGVRVEDLTSTDVGKALQSLVVHPTHLADQWSRYAADSPVEGAEDWELVRPHKRIVSVFTSPVRSDDGQSVIGRLWTFRDITEQRELEQTLRQSQKMESMGQLAGSIAHDFNNLLTVILGNLSIARTELQANLEAAEEATHEATQLARQLLGLSDRGGRLQLCPLDVNEVIHGVSAVLEPTAGPLVQVHLALANSLWKVPADADRVQQVILNLCMNAVDAMPGGGTLTVRTENIHVARGEHAMPLESQPGDYVRITVEDDGIGMDAELHERVFEPFFTTKSHLGSQGLGLAMAYGAVQRHGGWITCESEAGKGTRFEVYLLRTEQRNEPMKLRPINGDQEGGAPCVLVVDDEAGVRRIAVSVLNRCGYTTMQAGDGEEALSRFRESGGGVDLVLLDLSMPKLSGRETFLELKRMRVDVPVLLCSGYPVSLDDFERETGFRPDGVIQKPFNVMGLGSRVKEILSAHSGVRVAT